MEGGAGLTSLSFSFIIEATALTACLTMSRTERPSLRIAPSVSSYSAMELIDPETSGAPYNRIQQQQTTISSTCKWQTLQADRLDSCYRMIIRHKQVKRII